MLQDIGKTVITCTDVHGEVHRFTYDDILIDLGRSEKLTLTECILEEEGKVAEFQRDAAGLAGKIESLTPCYLKHNRTERAWHAECRRRTKGIHKLSYNKRIKLLNHYFCADGRHARVLDTLLHYVLAGTEGDHSEHIKSLIRFTIDYTSCVMKDVVRKTGRPCVLHSLAAARGVAKNGQNHVTILGTLLHDVLEERVDVWTDRFVRRMAADPRYGGEVVPEGEKVPKALREKILLDHQEEYSDRATAFYYAIGLALFDHVRKFPQHERFYQMLNSIMEMLEKLSRTSDLSYYEYLQHFVYPRRGQLDTMKRERLLELLSEEFEDPEELLDEYLENVDGFYQTSEGEFYSREEVNRNALREILAKIVDRMNNTRDMDRGLGFNIPSRLYGAGFKNIYFVQALEDKMAQPGLPGNERRLIQVKFLKKPKIAALFQIIADIAYLERERFGRGYLEMLERELEKYKHTPQFRKLTPPEQGGLFDGTIYFFNNVVLGKKAFLKEIEETPDKQAEYLVAFRAVLEAYLVYPALIERDMEENGYTRPSQSKWRRYRIDGMGPRLSHHVGLAPSHSGMQMKTFRRRVV